MKSIQILFLTTLLLPASPIEASGFFSWFRGAAPETTPAVQKKIPLSAQERLLKQVKNDVGLKNVATQFNKSQQQKSLGQPGITPYTLEQQLKNYTQQLEQKRRLYVTRANSTPNENRSYSKENPILFKEITDLENQIGTLREQSVMTRINALDNQTSAEDLNTLFKEISKNTQLIDSLSYKLAQNPTILTHMKIIPVRRLQQMGNDSLTNLINSFRPELFLKPSSGESSPKESSSSFDTATYAHPVHLQARASSPIGHIVSSEFVGRPAAQQHQASSSATTPEFAQAPVTRQALEQQLTDLNELIKGNEEWFSLFMKANSSKNEEDKQSYEKAYNKAVEYSSSLQSAYTKKYAPKGERWTTDSEIAAVKQQLNDLSSN